MKKIFLALLLYFVFMVPQAFAVVPAPPPGSSPRLTPWTNCIAQGTADVATLNCIPIIMQNLINFLAIFAGVVAVLLLLYAGFRFITSQGDPEKVANARRTMVYVLWGAIIVALSFTILMLISQFTGVQQIAPKR